jgi:hypothetical protein
MAKVVSLGRWRRRLQVLYFSLEASIDWPLPFARRALSRCKTLTFWSGDGGAGGVASLLGGIVFEACACQSVTATTVIGKEGGGLAEDSSFRCS